MKHDRLHGLSDGIFAIAMTLLVLNIKLPELEHVNNHTLWNSLTELTPIFLSYILSFAVLFMFWRGHNFVVSNLARNITVPLSNINAIFLLLVVFLPFSAEFLGRYHDHEIAIALYGINVIALSVVLIFMRKYIVKSEKIENNPNWTDAEHLNARIRMATPAVSAAIAIVVGIWNKDAALWIFTLALLLSFTSRSTAIVRRIIGRPA